MKGREAEWEGGKEERTAAWMNLGKQRGRGEEGMVECIEEGRGRGMDKGQERGQEEENGEKNTERKAEREGKNEKGGGIEKKQRKRREGKGFCGWTDDGRELMKMGDLYTYPCSLCLN